MKPQGFKLATELRLWFETNHDRSRELWIRFYKKTSGKPSITYPEALDEALCFGWIDGLRKSIDESSYTIRFTPRKPRSVWSVVNTKRAEELARDGRMQPPGAAAFEKRNSEETARYSYERENTQLGENYENQFKSHRKAWGFFQAQAPWYRRTATAWVISAKKEETRQKRLTTLIACSGRKKRIPQLEGYPKRARGTEK